MSSNKFKSLKSFKSFKSLKPLKSLKSFKNKIIGEEEPTEDIIIRRIQQSEWDKMIFTSKKMKKNILGKIQISWKNHKDGVIYGIWCYLTKYKSNLMSKSISCNIYYVCYDDISKSVLDEYLYEMKNSKNNEMKNICKEMLILFLLEHDNYLKEEIKI